MGLHWRLLFLYIGIALLLESNLCIAGVRISKASAQTLAKRTGAAHFEEHFEEIASSEESDEHSIRKRQSDEDFDYEVYQGVVGRPGIDFPVLPRIPQTQFSCRKFGNGYFADLETECQVFHICDDGRKISFLCPNGTIFQQTELICDWWFKVNCAASPGHYAESAEMLSRAQQNRHNHRQNSHRAENEFHSDGGFQRPNVQVNGNKNQYPVKSSPKYEQSDRLNKDRKPNRRIDSDEVPSSETYDFEDISDDKKHHKIEKFTDKSSDGGNAETQELAETASFVPSGKQRNGYNYGVPGQSTTISGYNPNFNRDDEKPSGNDKRGRGRFDVKDGSNSQSGKNVEGRVNGHQRNSQGSNDEDEYSGFSTKAGRDHDAPTRGSNSRDRNQQRENSKHGSGHPDDVENQQNGRRHGTGRSRTTIEPTTTFSRGQSRHPTSSRQERKHSSTSDGKANTLDKEFERKTTIFPRHEGAYSVDGGFSTIADNENEFSTSSRNNNHRTSTNGINGKKTTPVTKSRNNEHHTTTYARGSSGTSKRPTGKPNLIDGDIDIFEGETTNSQGGFSYTTISANGIKGSTRKPTGTPKSSNNQIGDRKLNGDIDIFGGDTTSSQGTFTQTTISAIGGRGHNTRPTKKQSLSDSGTANLKLNGDIDNFEGDTTSTQGTFSQTTISGIGGRGHNTRPTKKQSLSDSGTANLKLNGDIDSFEGETTDAQGRFSQTTIPANGIKGNTRRPTGKPNLSNSGIDGIDNFEGETTSAQGRFSHTTISSIGIKGNNKRPTGKPNFSNSEFDDNKLNGEYGTTTIFPSETKVKSKDPTFKGKVSESDLNVSIFGGGSISPKGKSEQTTHSSLGSRGQSTRQPNGRPHIGVDDSDHNASISGDEIENNQRQTGFSTGTPGITRIPTRHPGLNIDQNGEATTSIPGDEIIIGLSNDHHKGTDNQFGSSSKPNQVNRNGGPVKTKSHETDDTKISSADKNKNGNIYGSGDDNTKTTNSAHINGNKNNIHESTIIPGSNTSPSSNGRKPNTYTTARKLDTTRTTPYYTPTVPTVLSRFGETKTSSFEPTTASPSGHISGATRTPSTRSTTSSRGYTVFTPSTLFDGLDGHFTATTSSPRFSTISGSAVEISGDESAFSSIPPYLTNSLNNDLLPPLHSTSAPHGSTISGGASSSRITPSPYGPSTLSVGVSSFGSTPSSIGYSTVNIPSLSLSSGTTNLPGGSFNGITNSLSSFPTTFSSRGSFSSTTSFPRFSTDSGPTYLPRGSSASSTNTPFSQSSLSASTYLPRGSSILTTGKPSISDSTYHSTTPFTGGSNDLSFGKTQSPSNYVTTSRPSSSGPTYLPTESTAPTTFRPSSSGPTYLPKSSSSGPTYLPRGPTKGSSTNTEGLESPVSEHIKEMIKTLNDLNVDTTSISGASKKNGSRPFMIPPSSGPETLQALANYFATSDDISVTTEKSGTTPEYGDSKTELSAAHLSNKTIGNYENLFGLGTTEKSAEPTIKPNFEPKFAFDSNDLEGQHTGTPFEDASGKPETRKIAQVFSNGLSEYLRDPNGTRQFLEGLRPTEPPTTEYNDVDVTGRTTRKYFDKGTGATYLPTVGISATTLSTPTTTDDLEVLDFSDVTLPNGKKISGSNSAYTAQTTTYSPTTEKGTFTGKPGTVDRIPASRYIAESVERNAKNQNSHDSGEATTEYNPLAAEVNKGLGLSTAIPYLDNGESVTARKPTLQLDILPPGVSSSSQNNKNNFGQGSTTRPGDFVSTTSSIDGSTVSPNSAVALGLIPRSGDKLYDLPSSDILPPVSEEEEDTLQRAQSQSFVPSGNVLLGPEDRRDKTKASGSKPTNIPGHYITRLMSDNVVSTTEFPDIGKISPNPWSSVAYTVFLDPLTINDGLMGSEDFKPTTSSPFTYLPKSGSTTTESNPVRFDLGAIMGVPSEHDKSQSSSSTARTGKLIPDFPEHLLPPPNGMQKMANKMFGGLNETSADHLMSVMKKAEDNRSVRRLILLLIQTCDDDYSKTVEQSRQALLNALIGMDGPLKTDDEVEVIKVHPNRRGKSISSSNIGPNSLTPTTSEIPITTYRRTTEYGLPTSTVSSSSAEWSSSTTDTSFSHSTTTPSNSMEETTKFQSRTTEGSAESGTSTTTQSSASQESHESTTTTYGSADSSPISLKAGSRRKAKDIESSLGQPDFSHKNSDERALELLKSLYSLASKFYRR